MKRSKQARLGLLGNQQKGLSIWLAFLLIFTTGCELFEDEPEPEPLPPSSINTLTSLSVSTGSLSPEFSNSVSEYSVTVENTIDSVSVTATLESNLASLEINGNTTASGSPSDAIDLIVGDNSISVVVTAENGDVRNTTITVTRQEAPELSVSLTSLQLSDISLTPEFDSETDSYTATVAGNIESTVITAVTEDPSATLYYGSQGPLASGTQSDPIALEVGDNNLAVEVHSADDQTIKAYYILVTRQAPLGTDATLDWIQLSAGELSPNFEYNIFNYTASVAYSVDSISLTPELNDDNATISINGVEAINRQESAPISLDEGENTISVVVTAEDNSTTETYTVIVTRQAGAEFAQEAYIKASNTDSNDFFGHAIAVDGNTLAISAFQERSLSSGINGDETNNDASNVGAVYVFVRDNDTWTQQAYIKASNPEQNDYFGFSLDLSGDTLAVGARYEDSSAIGINGDQSNNDEPNSGAVYIFVRDSGTWTQQAYIKASNTNDNDHFGYSVAIEDDTLAVGAIYEDSNATGINGDELNNSAVLAGAVYIFARNDITWSQQAYIKASNTGEGDFFGSTIALNANTLAVSAVAERSSATGVNGDQADDSLSNTGAVYVYTRDGQNWSQQAYIKASNTDANDEFGHSLALLGDSLLITAPFENSNATGINGDEFDNSINDSGAAYLFTRVAGNWSQQAYIKAANPGAEDFFGIRAAISNDYLAIGAYLEDGSGTGILTEEQPGTAFNSGVVYMFEGSDDNWEQIAYVKSSNAANGDAFGLDLAMTDDIMVVGAREEDSNATGVNGDQSNNDASSSGASYVFTLGELVDNQANASLTNLSLSQGVLSPNFSTSTLNYTATVANNQTEVQVLATASSNGASITVNSVAVNSGELSDPITLEVGENNIDVEVLAADGITANTYSINLTREAQANDDASLSGLVISSGTLTPSFDSNVYNYTAEVGFATNSITVTPTLSDTNATVTVNGNLTASSVASVAIALNEGSNNIALEVLAEDGSTAETYEIVVTRESANQFAQEAYIKASNAGSGDRFGYATAMSGNTLVVGAPYESSAATGINGDQSDNSAETAGAAYVFIRDNGGTWTQQAYLKASNAEAGDRFGIDVSIDGDTIAIGADQESSNAQGVNGDQNDNSTNFAGAVYVYTRLGSTWSQQAYLKAATNLSYAYFGASLSLDDDRLAIGGTGGRVVTYTRINNTWEFEAELLADNHDSNDRFGASIDLDGNTMIVGAYLEDGSANTINGSVNDDTENAGAAYIFTFSNGFWTQQAYLKADNANTNYLFGFSVALDGDLAVVGSNQESSSASGINGDGSDSSSTNSGAAYVFSRSGNTWSQQAFIKASTPNANDNFGTSVDIEGNRVAVGSIWEASNATEANGDEDNNAAFQSGAVYLYDSDGFGSWTQSAYIKASNTGVSDYFGRSVTLNGTKLYVGADLENSAATGINGDQASNTAGNAGAIYVIESE